MSAPNFAPLPKKSPHGHTVHDVRAAGFTLEPMACINPACSDPASGNVAFDQAVGDAYCSECGEWQDDIGAAS